MFIGIEMRDKLYPFKSNSRGRGEKLVTAYVQFAQGNLKALRQFISQIIVLFNINIK